MFVGDTFIMIEQYIDCMVLSGVGDALGYKNQEWEYCKSGSTIHKQLSELGGLKSINLKLPDWPVSDDTVMHLATAEGIIESDGTKPNMITTIAKKYKECMNDMEGRKPGPTSIKGCNILQPDQPNGTFIPFNPTGTGCGAAMRTMCVGLAFAGLDQVNDLIEVSIEAGRLTHNHPTGFLGALASAAFVAFAVQNKPLVTWGKALLDMLPKAWAYVESCGRDVPENRAEWKYFEEKWCAYLTERGLAAGNPTDIPTFPEVYDVEARDLIYASWSLDGWAGRSGHDAPMIAYDSLLAAQDDWEKLCSHSMFHAGDSDSTGVIAAACFGVLWKKIRVPECLYMGLEYKTRLESAGATLYERFSAKSEIS